MFHATFTPDKTRSLVQTIEGPKLMIHAALPRYLGLEAAAFLSQAAYFSCKQKDGWFYLPATGDANPTAKSLYQKLGSWEAILGISAKTQRTIRKKLKDMGVLEEQRKGIPARLYYKINLNEYLEMLAKIGLKPPTLPDVPSGHIKNSPQTSPDVPSGHIKSSPEGTSIYKIEKRKKNTHNKLVCEDEIAILFAKAMKDGEIKNPGGYLKALMGEHQGFISDEQVEAVLNRGRELLEEENQLTRVTRETKIQHTKISNLINKIIGLEELGLIEQIPPLKTELTVLQSSLPRAIA